MLSLKTQHNGRMVKSYVVVTELEFDNLLKYEKGWTKDYQGSELVYSYNTVKNPNIQIKVYSSLTKSGVCRKCGGDAIRIVAINTKTNKGVLKSSRTYRVPGWEVRVKEKVIGLINQIW